MNEATVSELVSDASETIQRPHGSFGVRLPQESESCGPFLRSFIVIVIAKVNVAS